MSLTNAFSTALSGLDANSQFLDIAGNNIANVNTPGYKSKQALFATQFSESLSLGSPPTSESGGTNPVQAGLGTRIAGTQTDFSGGGIQATGIATNLAIEGDGFFVLEQTGEQFFSRDGQFALDSQNKLVSVTGARVQGFGVDSNFNLIPGVLSDMQIELGTLTVAEETGNVSFEGNLNAAGPVSTGGSQDTTRAFFTDALLTPGNEETGTTDLTVVGNDLYISDGAGGSFLAFEGGTDTVITVSGVEKGGKVLADKSFAFSLAPPAGVDDSGTTINDFIDFLNSALGLSNITVNGETLGGQVALAGGQLTITGNEGKVQDLRVATGNFTASSSAPGFSAIANPLVTTNTRDADGESARTSFVIYDSLGTPVTIDVSFVKQSVVADGGTIWQWLAESNDNDALPQVLGLGNIEFDQNGVFVSATNQAFSINRLNGADDPLTVNMEFDNGIDSVTALADDRSTVAVVRQDGSAIGSLDSFSVDDEGQVIGAFTNGLTRTVGQLSLAKFINNNGLVEVGNNLYSIGPNSGNPVIGSPGAFNGGRVISGALEQSNVDLASEFVNLISASTGFSAASRVITTADQIIQQLLVLGR